MDDKEFNERCMREVAIYRNEVKANTGKSIDEIIEIERRWFKRASKLLGYDVKHPNDS